MTSTREEIQQIICDAFGSYSVPRICCDQCVKNSDKILKLFTDKIDEKIESLDNEMLSSKTNDDVKVFTIREMKARQISKLEELKQSLRE